MKYLIIVSLFLCCCLQANSQDYLKLANECFEKGDYECAKRNYTFFQTFDGSDMSAQIQKTDECMRALLLADEFFKDEEWEKARDRYQIVLEKNPKDPHAKKQLDLCEERLKAESDKLQQEEAQKRDVAENEVKLDDNIILPVQNQKQPVNPIIEKETKSGRSGLLFAAGGVSIAGGIAATVFLPVSKSKDIRDGRLLEDKKHTYLFAAAGIVVGGICIGSGIKLKKKESVKPHNTDLSYHTTTNINNCSRLDFVVYGNEAGLRLTF